ncbi:hypothetical protein D3C79_390950 [compost metagenome]
MQPFTPAVAQQFQMLQTNMLASRVDVLLAGDFDGPLIRAEAPQVNQRADGDIHSTSGITANALSGEDDIGHSTGDGLRLGSGVLVEAG